MSSQSWKEIIVKYFVIVMSFSLVSIISCSCYIRIFWLRQQMQESNRFISNEHNKRGIDHNHDYYYDLSYCNDLRLYSEIKLEKSIFRSNPTMVTPVGNRVQIYFSELNNLLKCCTTITIYFSDIIYLAKKTLFFLSFYLGINNSKWFKKLFNL